MQAEDPKGRCPDRQGDGQSLQRPGGHEALPPSCLHVRDFQKCSSHYENYRGKCNEEKDFSAKIRGYTVPYLFRFKTKIV
jgi:hypothetical protein